ncbi:MAG: LD-carboxypeptidase [Bacteroidota bacterium]|nr:LD-carboxypeptidase [Bacteroidota bacterium]
MAIDLVSRRKFIAGMSASALAAVYPPSFLSRFEEHVSSDTELSLIKPKALKPGDTVGIIAPASNVYEHEEIVMGREIIESLGFKTVLGKNTARQYGYLAGSDEQRADDMNEMFHRDDIDGIICLRGGWGSMRILPMLDYEMMRKNPKVLMGYSDITSLLLAVYKHAGIVTFHGPVVLSTYNDYTMEYLTKAVFTPQPVGLIKNPPLPSGEKVEQENRIIRLGKGKGSGALVGGNLSLLVSTLGTPFEVDLKGKVLFIEEVGEEPYRVDRMLTHLWLTGKLQELAGLVIGKLTDCTPNDYKPAFPQTLSVEEILRTRIEPLGIPAVYGLMIGHIKDKITVPLGIQATLDGDAGTLTIDESAVV